MTEEYTYQRGETVPIWAYIQKWDDTFVDPTTATLVLTDPKGVKKVDGETFVKDGVNTGKWVYYYNSQADDEIGFWRAVGTITDGAGAGAKVTIVPSGFKLQ